MMKIPSKYIPAFAKSLHTQFKKLSKEQKAAVIVAGIVSSVWGAFEMHTSFCNLTAYYKTCKINLEQEAYRAAIAQNQPANLSTVPKIAPYSDRFSPISSFIGRWILNRANKNNSRAVMTFLSKTEPSSKRQNYIAINERIVRVDSEIVSIFRSPDAIHKLKNLFTYKLNEEFGIVPSRSTDKATSCDSIANYRQQVKKLMKDILGSKLPKKFVDIEKIFFEYFSLQFSPNLQQTLQHLSLVLDPYDDTISDSNTIAEAFEKIDKRAAKAIEAKKQQKWLDDKAFNDSAKNLKRVELKELDPNDIGTFAQVAFDGETLEYESINHCFQLIFLSAYAKSHPLTIEPFSFVREDSVSKEAVTVYNALKNKDLSHLMLSKPQPKIDAFDYLIGKPLPEALRHMADATLMDVDVDIYEFIRNDDKENSEIIALREKVKQYLEKNATDIKNDLGTFINSPHLREGHPPRVLQHAKMAMNLSSLMPELIESSSQELFDKLQLFSKNFEKLNNTTLTAEQKIDVLQMIHFLSKEQIAPINRPALEAWYRIRTYKAICVDKPILSDAIEDIISSYSLDNKQLKRLKMKKATIEHSVGGLTWFAVAQKLATYIHPLELTVSNGTNSLKPIFERLLKKEAENDPRFANFQIDEYLIEAAFELQPSIFEFAMTKDQDAFDKLLKIAIDDVFTSTITVEGLKKAASATYQNVLSDPQLEELAQEIHNVKDNLTQIKLYGLSEDDSLIQLRYIKSNLDDLVPNPYEGISSAGLISAFKNDTLVKIRYIRQCCFSKQGGENTDCYPLFNLFINGLNKDDYNSLFPPLPTVEASFNETQENMENIILCLKGNPDAVISHWLDSTADKEQQTQRYKKIVQTLKKIEKFDYTVIRELSIDATKSRDADFRLFVEAYETKGGDLSDLLTPIVTVNPSSSNAAEQPSFNEFQTFFDGLVEENKQALKERL